MNRLPGGPRPRPGARSGRRSLPADGRAGAAGSRVTVLVRPEAIVVAPDDAGDATVVVVATFRGSHDAAAPAAQ